MLLLSRCWGGEKITSQPEKRLLDKQKLFVDTLYKYTGGKGGTCSFITLMCLYLELNVIYANNRKNV